MKILITTDTYFPMINGVVTSINNLYNELKNKGHDVRILTLSHSRRGEVVGDIYYLKSIGVKIYPNARVKIPFRNKLIRNIVNWKPDIIHSQTEFSTMIVAKHISNKLNIPHIHTYHTMYEDYLGYILGGKILRRSTAARLTRMLLNSLDAVIVPTEKARHTLLSYGVRKTIHIAPTGIDLSNFQRSISEAEKEELLSKLSLNKGDRIMAYVGRIAEEKNINEIIDLFPDVIDKMDNVKLLIVGGGPYLKHLKQQVKEQGLEKNILFTGMVKPEEVYKYYKLAEIFVTASTSETQGLTYIEALSSGCPVVCKWDPCVEGLISQGENGFAYKDKYEFSQHVCEILQNDNLRKQMTLNSISKSKQYSSDVFADNLLRIYSKTLNPGSSIIAV
ncbi:MAG: glycosyltransferase family 4 protein [Bacillota bacterium]|nr:glycosyltransferase family 4 protein [Bacillota bacterium]